MVSSTTKNQSNTTEKYTRYGKPKNREDARSDCEVILNGDKRYHLIFNNLL